MTNYFEKELYINPSLADADGLLSRYETFNIFIPVAIEYYWGVIEDELVIQVKDTGSTTPQSL